MKAIIFTLLVIIFLSCSKDYNVSKEQLPQSTTTGKDTFGCLVDNVVWLPRSLSSSLFVSLPILSFNYSNKYQLLLITARREYAPTNNYEDIKINVDSVFKVGTYYLNDVVYPYSDTIVSPNSSYFEKVCNNTRSMYYNKDYSKNILNITHLDTIAHIISGTFEMELSDTVNNKKVHITNGIFDIKYLQ